MHGPRTSVRLSGNGQYTPPNCEGDVQEELLLHMM